MKKNEDRIWDVLLEDAMRDMPAPEPAPVTEPGDYTRRLLTPIGPPGVDRGRSMRRTRSRRWASVTATLVAFLFVAGLFYAAVTWLPGLTEDNHADQPQTAGDNNPAPVRDGGGQDTPDKPSPKPNAAPENAPKDNTPPEPEVSDQPDPTPNEQPEPPPGPKPDDQVDQPEPETQPEPTEPEDTVEQPKQPEDTVEQPKPDETEPKQPEETTPELAKEYRIYYADSSAVTHSDNSTLVTSTDRENWSGVKYIEDFSNDLWFKGNVDLEAGGVLIHLQGEAQVKLSDVGLTIQLADDNLLIDNRGANRPVNVEIASHTLELKSGVALIEKSTQRSTVSVYRGEVMLGEETISTGYEIDLRKSGPGRPKLNRKLLLQDFPSRFGIEDRIAYREDFDEAEPKGRLREGSIEEGVLKGNSVFWGFPEDFHFEVGLTVRLRVRFTGVDSVTLTLFSAFRNDNFSYQIDADHRLKIDEWYTLEVPLEEFLERTNHKDGPTPGDWFKNISLAPTGEGAQVELDWVELIRAVKKHEED